MSHVPPINTASDWRTQYSHAQEYLKATNRLIQKRVESVRSSADPENTAKLNSMIRRDIHQLELTYALLVEKAESLNHSHSITSREYMDFMNDLSPFLKALQSASSKVTVSNRDLSSEEYIPTSISSYSVLSHTYILAHRS